MALVNFRAPAIPDSAVVKATRSLGSWQAIAAITLHCIGWRFRRVAQAIIAWGDADYRTNVAGVTSTHRVRLRTSPNATHLFVAFVYQAMDEVSGGSQITLNLYTVAGVLLDGPVTFDTTVGTLASQTIARGGMFGGLAAEAPYLTAHTGVAEDPPLVDRPRCLVLGSTARNVDCELRITTVSCRLRSITAWELPTQVVT